MKNNIHEIPAAKENSYIYNGDCLNFLNELSSFEPVFDLVITSPPYNIGKEYETKQDIESYKQWQKEIIEKIIPLVKDNGSICWQIGNFVDNGEVIPLDIELAPIFYRNGLQLRNRIIWTFGHGLHSKKRFSGRYEVVLWFTKTDKYTFNLDEVRVPVKYPGKRYYKGPKTGQLSSNPLGKNPEDVWTNIPNVKSNHIEKTIHPCQFPVALVERLIIALTNPGDLVFDPFCGVASTAVAAIVHDRRFVGCELMPEYIKVGNQRINDAIKGSVKYRPHDKPLYDSKKSYLSRDPNTLTRYKGKQK